MTNDFITRNLRAITLPCWTMISSLPALLFRVFKVYIFDRKGQWNVYFQLIMIWRRDYVSNGRLHNIYVYYIHIMIFTNNKICEATWLAESVIISKHQHHHYHSESWLFEGPIWGVLRGNGKHGHWHIVIHQLVMSTWVPLLRPLSQSTIRHA